MQQDRRGDSDPLVTSHGVSEGDNNKMDTVVPSLPPSRTYKTVG